MMSFIIGASDTPNVFLSQLYYPTAMKTIIVPTDYSENAWYATEYAAQVAQQTGAGIILFHAIQLPFITTEVPVDHASLDELNRHHTVRLLEMTGQLIRKYHIKVTYKLKVGTIAELLAPFFKEEQADLIIMGLRGSNPVGRLLMGSVTASVLKRAKLPVLVIPRDFTFRGIRHILFACDFEPLSSPHVLRPLQDIAKAFDATVEVMHLPQPLAAGRKSEAMVEESYWEDQLQDIRLGYTFLYEEDIQKGIDQGVCESHADLLTMVPHRHTFFENIFNKSNVQKMAFHTRIPLLALPDAS